MILEIAGAIAIGYQLFALLACLRFPKAARVKTPPQTSRVSILKPIHGADAGLRAAIASHMGLQGDFELLCGVRPGDDAALSALREFPKVRVIECRTETPNRKVGVLMDLVREARHSILIVNDADIRVEPDYLMRVTAPLDNPRVGLVTCLYRTESSTLAGRFEGLGVATDFAPSAMAARMVGVKEFAMGSTLAFHRADLERMGGFEAISAYLADDYQLGARLHALGRECVLSEVIVDTRLGGGWRDVWRHQVRWARTIRVSKFGGYLGLPATFATFWSVAAACGGRWGIAAVLLAARLLMATVAGWFVMRSRDVLRLWLLIPARDLFGVAVWAAALFGRSVVWRGETLRLDAEGRIAAREAAQKGVRAGVS